MNDIFYLKPNVVIEPLFKGWYAWSHLISPATAAMNVVNRHLSIIDSYLSAPDIHAEAIQNPQLRGGPFMDFKYNRVREIEELKMETLSTQKNLIELAAAIRALDELLFSEAKGYSLELLYEKVPAALKGYVELFYDRNNYPGFRFYESLLYKSKYYNESFQSLALWLTNNDERPFVLSTPRLPETQVLHLPIPFRSPVIDELAQMKRSRGSLELITQRLQIPETDQALFKTFFTKDEPPVYTKYRSDKIRMRYFGHACILIETSEVSILVDPLISYYGYHSSVEHFSDVDLPAFIDYVLITHNHQDHILFETLLPLRHKIGKLVIPATNSGRLEDPDLKLMFQNIGFSQVISIGELEEINFLDLTITGVPFMGEHSDMNIMTKSCYLVDIGRYRLLFLADSRINSPQLYEHISKVTGTVDVMFLGMECDGAPLSWLYGPLLTRRLPRDQDNSRRLSGSDCSRGISLIEIFKPKEVYVYAMGQEPWVEFISSIKYTDESNPIVQSNQLVKYCHAKGIIAERLYGEKELLYTKPVTS